MWIVWGGPEDPQNLSNILKIAKEVEAQGQIRISQSVGSSWPVQWSSALTAHQNNLGTLKHTCAEAQLQGPGIAICKSSQGIQM